MAFLTLTSKQLKYLAHPILWNVWALYLLDRENMNNRLEWLKCSSFWSLLRTTKFFHQFRTFSVYSLHNGYSVLYAI